MKKRFVRTPETDTIVADDALQVNNLMIIPTIDPDNESVQEAGAIGFRGGLPVYFDGTEFKPLGSGGSASTAFADITGSPSDNTALNTDLTRIEGKAEGAQSNVDTLGVVVATKLTGTAAVSSDVETQNEPSTENNTFISVKTFIHGLNWLKTQIMTFAETITFTKMLVLSAATPNYFLSVDAGRKTETKYQPVSPYITDVAVQGYLSNPTNWNGSGVYIGPAIVQTQGAIHIDAQYQYEMFDPTTPKRTSIIGGTEHLIGTSGTPSISAGVGAGTSPTIAITGNDVAGRITLTTGTSPTADGIVCTVTFNRPRSGPPRATVGARNKAALNLCWVSNETTNTFVVSGNLAASTQYILNYLVAQ